jgi:hypothetical protein
LLPDATGVRQWPGALSVLRFEVERVVRVAGGLPVCWSEQAG